MFKSVFTKYLFVFMLIVLISFLVLSAITMAVVSNYLSAAKADVVFRAANAAAGCVIEQYNDMNAESISWFIGWNKETLSAEMRAIAAYSEDLTILLVDNNGKVLYVANSTKATDVFGITLPEEIIYDFANSTEPKSMDPVEGLFEKTQLTYSVTLDANSEKSNIIGTLFVCASSTAYGNLVELMIKSILVSSLWVMLAALVAVYFLTEKIVSPLKQMSRAAKSFAAGDFSVRVPVVGKDEVAQLAEAFNNMASSLSNSDNMRTTFMANVSHDLRTPMTTIAGFIDGILAGAIPPEKHEYYLGVIASEVRRLSRLVSQLLDISRLQAGDRKFNMQPFDVCEMGRQILISFEQVIDKKHLEVEFDCDYDNMFANADHDAIYQILYNICDNAVKFSREGGVLRLSIHEKVVEDEKHKLVVEVYNEGNGIPPEDLPYVFERFYKSDKSRGLDKTGVGLGLFIVKAIIEAHHEKISVDSEYGKYCRFVFTLAKVSP